MFNYVFLFLISTFIELYTSHTNAASRFRNFSSNFNDTTDASGTPSRSPLSHRDSNPPVTHQTCDRVRESHFPLLIHPRHQFYRHPLNFSSIDNSISELLVHWGSIVSFNQFLTLRTVECRHTPLLLSISNFPTYLFGALPEQFFRQQFTPIISYADIHHENQLSLASSSTSGSDQTFTPTSLITSSPNHHQYPIKNVVCEILKPDPISIFQEFCSKIYENGDMMIIVFRLLPQRDLLTWMTATLRTKPYILSLLYKSGASLNSIIWANIYNCWAIDSFKFYISNANVAGQRVHFLLAALRGHFHLISECRQSFDKVFDNFEVQTITNLVEWKSKVVKPYNETFYLLASVLSIIVDVCDGSGMREKSNSIEYNKTSLPLRQFAEAIHEKTIDLPRVDSRIHLIYGRTNLNPLHNVPNDDRRLEQYLVCIIRIFVICRVQSISKFLQKYTQEAKNSRVLVAYLMTSWLSGLTSVSLIEFAQSLPEKEITDSIKSFARYFENFELKYGILNRFYDLVGEENVHHLYQIYVDRNEPNNLTMAEIMSRLSLQSVSHTADEFIQMIVQAKIRYQFIDGTWSDSFFTEPGNQDHTNSIKKLLSVMYDEDSTIIITNGRNFSIKLGYTMSQQLARIPIKYWIEIFGANYYLNRPVCRHLTVAYRRYTDYSNFLRVYLDFSWDWSQVIVLLQHTEDIPKVLINFVDDLFDGTHNNSCREVQHNSTWLHNSKRH